MKHDYYAILRVSRDANLAEIRAAYRRRVLESHPDRGGSHAEIVLVIEAWEILSDPEKRRRYDSAAGIYSEAVEQDVREARETSQQYPQNRDDIETWLNRVTADVQSAEYGRAGTALGDFPLVHNSFSGLVFWCGGFLLGFAMVFYLSSNLDIYKTLRVSIFGGAGGVWLGVALHKKLRDSLNNQNPQSRSGSDANFDAGMVVIGCEKCGQKLRLPKNESELSVTCPTCRHQFSYTSPPAETSAAPHAARRTPNETDPVPVAKSILIWVVIIGSVIFVVRGCLDRMTKDVGDGLKNRIDERVKQGVDRRFK